MSVVTFAPARRRFIWWGMRIGGGILASASGTVSLAGAEAPAAERRRFMDLAFEMRRRAAARGDQAFGAVVVRDGQGRVLSGPSLLRTS